MNTENSRWKCYCPGPRGAVLDSQSSFTCCHRYADPSDTGHTNHYLKRATKSRRGLKSKFITSLMLNKVRTNWQSVCPPSLLATSIWTQVFTGKHFRPSKWTNRTKPLLGSHLENSSTSNTKTANFRGYRFYWYCRRIILRSLHIYQYSLRPSLWFGNSLWLIKVSIDTERASGHLKRSQLLSHFSTANCWPEFDLDTVHTIVQTLTQHWKHDSKVSMLTLKLNIEPFWQKSVSVKSILFQPNVELHPNDSNVQKNVATTIDKNITFRFMLQHTKRDRVRLVFDSNNPHYTELKVKYLLEQMFASKRIFNKDKKLTRQLAIESMPEPTVPPSKPTSFKNQNVPCQSTFHSYRLCSFEDDSSSVNSGSNKIGDNSDLSDDNDAPSHSSFWRHKHWPLGSRQPSQRRPTKHKRYSRFRSSIEFAPNMKPVTKNKSKSMDHINQWRPISMPANNFVPTDQLFECQANKCLFGNKILLTRNGQLPNTVMDLLVTIYFNGLNVQGIFRKSGSLQRCVELRQFLERQYQAERENRESVSSDGSLFDSSSGASNEGSTASVPHFTDMFSERSLKQFTVHEIANTIKMLVRCLPDSLLSSQYYHQWVNIGEQLMHKDQPDCRKWPSQVQNECIGLIQSLLGIDRLKLDPKNIVNAQFSAKVLFLRYLVSLLYQVSCVKENVTHNLMTPYNLGVCFAPSILKSLPTEHKLSDMPSNPAARLGNSCASPNEIHFGKNRRFKFFSKSAPSFKDLLGKISCGRSSDTFSLNHSLSSAEYAQAYKNSLSDKCTIDPFDMIGSLKHQKDLEKIAVLFEFMIVNCDRIFGFNTCNLIRIYAIFKFFDFHLLANKKVENVNEHNSPAVDSSRIQDGTMKQMENLINSLREQLFTKIDDNDKDSTESSWSNGRCTSMFKLNTSSDAESNFTADSIDGDMAKCGRLAGHLSPSQLSLSSESSRRRRFGSNRFSSFIKTQNKENKHSDSDVGRKQSTPKSDRFDHKPNWISTSLLATNESSGNSLNGTLSGLRSVSFYSIDQQTSMYSPSPVKPGVYQSKNQEFVRSLTHINDSVLKQKIIQKIEAKHPLAIDGQCPLSVSFNQVGGHKSAAGSDDDEQEENDFDRCNNLYSKDIDAEKSRYFSVKSMNAKSNRLKTKKNKKLTKSKSTSDCLSSKDPDHSVHGLLPVMSSQDIKCAQSNYYSSKPISQANSDDLYDDVFYPDTDSGNKPESKCWTPGQPLRRHTFGSINQLSNCQQLTSETIIPANQKEPKSKFSFWSAKFIRFRRRSKEAKSDDSPPYVEGKPAASKTTATKTEMSKQEAEIYFLTNAYL